MKLPDKKIIGSLLVFMLGVFVLQEVQAKTAPANISVGIVSKGGVYKYHFHNRDDIEIKSPGGKHLGGGLVLQKMFSNHIGLDSGLIYDYRRVTFLLKGSPQEYKWTEQSLTIPFRLITSLNAGVLSLNMLMGVKYSNTFRSTFKGGGHDSKSLMPKIDANQLALSLGLHFKFRVGKYHDIFLGIEGNGNLTSSLQKEGFLKHSMHYYDSNLVMGYLMRTNFFPIPKY